MVSSWWIQEQEAKDLGELSERNSLYLCMQHIDKELTYIVVQRDVHEQMGNAPNH